MYGVEFEEIFDSGTYSLDHLAQLEQSEFLGRSRRHPSQGPNRTLRIRNRRCPCHSRPGSMYVGVEEVCLLLSMSYRLDYCCFYSSLVP
jgi:hypothetical protein